MISFLLIIEMKGYNFPKVKFPAFAKDNME